LNENSEEEWGLQNERYTISYARS